MTKDLKTVAYGIAFLTCCVYVVWQLIVDPHFMIGQFVSLLVVIGILRLIEAWWNRKKYRVELERQIRDGLASGEIVVKFQDGSTARYGRRRIKEAHVANESERVRYHMNIGSLAPGESKTIPWPPEN
jgi:hypothetical protein